MKLYVKIIFQVSETGEAEVLFFLKEKRIKQDIYTTREIVGSGHILESFYIVLDADGNIHLYKRLAAKAGKTKLRKVAVNIPRKLAEWGVEMEKGDEIYRNV